MNTKIHELFSARVGKFTLNLSRKLLACSLAYLMIPLGMGDIYAYAQTAPPPPPDQQQQYQDQAPPPDQQYPDQYDENQGPPPEGYNALSPEQLNQLVAPIALYPDSLVAQILAASTYPTEIADADHFLEANRGASPDWLGDMANRMDWDPSVKALVAFPSILNNLDRNLDWTSQLGNAYYNQPQDVMSAVQEMRQRAYEAGNLRSTSQLDVDYSPDDIVIAPANPSVVYVPWYDPWAVYGSPISPWSGYYVSPRPAGLYFAAGLGLGFGVGIAVGNWNRWGWGYHNWGMGWRNRTIVYNRNVYISRSPHVRNHGYYGRFDRNPTARVYNRNIEVRGRRNPAFNGNRSGNNPRVAPFYNNNANRPNTNRPNTNQPNYNRPNSNVRRTPNLNQPENRPNNTTIQPFNRPNTNRPNTNRPNAQPNTNRPNAQPNTNRPNAQPNTNRPNTQPNTNRPNTQPNFNRPNTQPNTNRPNTNERSNFNRPNLNANRPSNTPRVEPFNRPNNPRPQTQVRPQAHPQARPEARPQSHPENRGRSSGDNPGHGHDKSPK